ncbi:MAG: hypothetical protein ACKVWV_02570 [Planctomycetota bacterium]
MNTIPFASRFAASVAEHMRTACTGVLEFFGLTRTPVTERVRISPRRPRGTPSAVVRGAALSAGEPLAGSDGNRRRRAPRTLRAYDEWNKA